MSSRSYTDEFKKQAVELAESLGSYTRASKQLGVPKTSIYSWKLKLKAGAGKRSEISQNESEIQAEMKLLRKENSELKQVNTLLKAAAAFFSQDHLKKNIF